MYVVEALDLTKIYRKRHIALNALNLRVEKGMTYGFAGPRGAGKTTTLRLLLGLQRPTAGRVRVFGEPMDADRADLRRRIGVLPARPALPRSMTPLSYLDFVGGAAGMTSGRTRIRAAALLQAVGLAGAASQRLGGFGEEPTKLLGVVAALMNDPELLVFDEPLSGLGPAARAQAIELIREVSGPDRTILVATRSLADVERVCTDLGAIAQGRLVYDGPVAEVRSLARHGLIAVEIEGDAAAFEVELRGLDEFGAVRYDRLGSEFRITFLGPEPIQVYLQHVLDLIGRTGVELLRLDTGGQEIEDVYLRRLEDDRMRGFLRAPAWGGGQLTGEAASGAAANTLP